MAVKRWGILLIFIAAICAIAALIYNSRTESARKRADIGKFVQTYASLSVVRDVYLNQPDSIRYYYDKIYSINHTDSAWMEQQVKIIGQDSDAYKDAWARIVDKLNDLRKKSFDDLIEAITTNRE